MPAKSLLLSILLFSVHFFSQTKAKVIGIKDGDTVEVLMEGNLTKVLRLAEVDCPENRQPFGKNAKQFTASQVFGKEIVFYETGKDRYGRVIAKVYYDQKKYLSAEIIKAGLGWWFYQYSKDAALGEMQQKAKTRKKGLWADKNAMAPWDFRKLKKTKKTISAI